MKKIGRSQNEHVLPTRIQDERIKCNGNANGECNRQISRFCWDHGYDGAVGYDTSQSDVEEMLRGIIGEDVAFWDR